MLLDLVRQYQDLIRAVEVERFRVVGTSYELKAVLSLKNGSQKTLGWYGHPHAGE